MWQIDIGSHMPSKNSYFRHDLNQTVFPPTAYVTETLMCCFQCPGNTSTYLCPVSRDSLTLDASFGSPVGSLDLVASGNTDSGSNNQLAESNNIQTSANNKNQSQEKRSAMNPGKISNFQPILMIICVYNSSIHCVWQQRVFIFICLRVFCGLQPFKLPW